MHMPTNSVCIDIYIYSYTFAHTHKVSLGVQNVTWFLFIHSTNFFQSIFNVQGIVLGTGYTAVIKKILTFINLTFLGEAAINKMVKYVK